MDKKEKSPKQGQEREKSQTRARKRKVSNKGKKEKSPKQGIARGEVLTPWEAWFPPLYISLRCKITNIIYNLFIGAAWGMRCKKPFNICSLTFHDCCTLASGIVFHFPDPQETFCWHLAQGRELGRERTSPIWRYRRPKCRSRYWTYDHEWLRQTSTWSGANPTMDQQHTHYVWTMFNCYTYLVHCRSAKMRKLIEKYRIVWLLQQRFLVFLEKSLTRFLVFLEKKV